MAKLRISALTESMLAVQVDDLDVLDEIRALPTKKYVARYRHWEVPATDANIAHLLGRFDKDDLSLSEEAKVIMRYVELRNERTTRKTQRRWEYVFHDQVPELPFQFHTEPYKHQIVALDAIHNTEFFGLLMDMGTGKSKVVLDEIKWAVTERLAMGVTRPYRALIIAPAGICTNWVKQMKTHWPPDFQYKHWILGLLPGAADQLIECARDKSPCKILICSYDRVSILLEFLKKFRWDLVVADELARLKSPYTKRTKACIDLSHSAADRRIGLTGTPVVNSICDVWAQFEFLSPACLGFANFHAFQARYEKNISVAGWKKNVGNRHVDELKAAMARYSFVVKAEDCLDLPAQIYEERSISMTEKQREVYDQMLTFLVGTLTDASDGASTVEARAMIAQIVKLRQICCGFFRNVDGDDVSIPGPNPKCDQLVDDLEDLNGKVIIWRAFTYDDHHIQKTLESLGIKFVKIVGGMSMEDRHAAMMAFNNDDEVKAIIAAPECAGEGIDLLGSSECRCSTAIYWSNSFALGPRLQSEKRNHRIGQDKPVTYIDYTMEDSIEEKIVAALQAKKDLAAEMTDVRSIKSLLLGA